MLSPWFPHIAWESWHHNVTISLYYDPTWFAESQSFSVLVKTTGKDQISVLADSNKTLDAEQNTAWNNALPWMDINKWENNFSSTIIIKRILHSPITDFISSCFDKAQTEKKLINLDLAWLNFWIRLHAIPLTNDWLHFIKTKIETKRLKKTLILINFPDQNSPRNSLNTAKRPFSWRNQQ